MAHSYYQSTDSGSMTANHTEQPPAIFPCISIPGAFGNQSRLVRTMFFPRMVVSVNPPSGGAVPPEGWWARAEAFGWAYWSPTGAAPTTNQILGGNVVARSGFQVAVSQSATVPEGYHVTFNGPAEGLVSHTSHRNKIPANSPALWAGVYVGGFYLNPGLYPGTLIQAECTLAAWWDDQSLA